ncbi:MAG: hypothetical protein ACYTGX_00190 [Planctomycetota bacterium]|jgi:hypothetical protein
MWTALLLTACLAGAEPEEPAAKAEAEAPPAPPGIIQQFLDAHGDFLDAAERAVPNLWLSHTSQGEVELGSLPGAYELERQVALARIPMPVHRDAYVVGTLYYHRRRFNVTEPMPGFPGDETVHALELGLATRFWIDPDLMIHPFVYAGLYSDLDGHPNRKDWQLYGGAVAYYRWFDTFVVRGGVAAANELEHVTVFPLVGFYWRPVEWLRVGLLAPFETHVAWWPAPWLEVLVQGTYEAYEHRVRMPRSAGHRQFDWTLQEYRLAAGVALHLPGGWRVRVMAGAQVTGGWKTRGATRNHSSLGAAPLIEFGLGWRVATD